jgi:hypothetical protein
MRNSDTPRIEGCLKSRDHYWFKSEPSRDRHREGEWSKLDCGNVIAEAQPCSSNIELLKNDKSIWERARSSCADTRHHSAHIRKDCVKRRSGDARGCAEVCTVFAESPSPGTQSRKARLYNALQ